jgi:hypothetical protein
MTFFKPSLNQAYVFVAFLLEFLYQESHYVFMISSNIKKVVITTVRFELLAEITLNWFKTY